MRNKGGWWRSVTLNDHRAAIEIGHRIVVSVRQNFLFIVAFRNREPSGCGMIHLVDISLAFFGKPRDDLRLSPPPFGRR